MNKKRLRGVAAQGKRSLTREALTTNARRRRGDGYAAKVSVLTRGDLASCPKGRRSGR